MHAARVVVLIAPGYKNYLAVFVKLQRFERAVFEVWFQDHAIDHKEAAHNVSSISRIESKAPFDIGKVI